MTPQARIEAAVEILNQLAATAQPADRFLRKWFSARRYAGAKDRAAVAERVYDVLRHRAEFSWRMGSEDQRAAVIASLLAQGETQAAIENLFACGGYGPSPLSEEERHAIASPPEGDPPQHVRGGYPNWLEPELERRFGASLLPEMKAMLLRAPVDMRVNLLRAERDDMLTGLRALGFDAGPTPYAPTGIRVPSGQGLGKLQHTAFFQTGAIEIQDEASQIVALLSAPQPGGRVLDLAAGAGGKALALAALMGNDGEIVACDTDARRLARLGPRARRAGTTIIRTLDLSEATPTGTFDVVLVDAPCSGSGTWRRNPELKWRLSPEQLHERIALQAQLIERGARYVRSGGRLVYATCSILPSENSDRIEAFLERNSRVAPGFVVMDAAKVWEGSVGIAPPPGMDRVFMASPATTGSDGFFVCVLARQ